MGLDRSVQMCYHISMPKVDKTKAQIAAETNQVIGRWRVDSVVEGSTRQINATCLECDQQMVRDIYDLTRKRASRQQRCKKCSNRQIIEGNRLSPGEALLRNQFHEYRKNAKARGRTWELDQSDFRLLINGVCVYCGTKPNRRVESAWDSIMINGIDRTDSNIGYVKENSVSCCKDCNYAKRLMSAQEFIQLCERVSNYAGSHYRAQK